MLVSTEMAKNFNRGASARDDVLTIPLEKVSLTAHPINGILSHLPSECRSRIMARAMLIPLVKRQVMLERNVPPRFAYFIESGAVSLFARAGADRASVEIGTLGGDDFVGIPTVLGVKLSPHRCVVQVPGSALRIYVCDLEALLEEFPELQRALLAYVHAALVHSSQLVACNTTHSLRERLARWLLVASDRLRSDSIPFTHDALSRAIAVRRAGVTTEMGRMEEAGLIGRHRGSISIVNRDGLENVSCSCYRVLRASANSCASNRQHRIRSRSDGSPDSRRPVVTCLE